MSTMSILRNAAKSHGLIRLSHQNRGLAALVHDSPRYFSTEAGQPNQESQDTTSDAFLQTPSTGLVYARLFGSTNHTMKSDIVNLLEGCKVTPDDIRVDRNRFYGQAGMMIQFPSRYAFDAAIRAIGRKGRLYRLERADRSQWDRIIPYNGKAILLQGIPRNALEDDIERFLSGCIYDSSTLQIFLRQAFPDPVKMAVVHFPSKAQAMHAYITKNRGFCLNNKILMRVLE